MAFGFWLIVACTIAITALSVVTFVLWNYRLDEWERNMQMLEDAAVFLDDLRRKLDIELKEQIEAKNPEVTD